MSEASEQLERLISRFLDDEASADERRALRGATRRDAAAAALLDETQTLDREIGRALRHALGRGLAIRPLVHRWSTAARLGLVAAAACLSLLIWRPPAPPTATDREQPRGASSWGVSGAKWGDVFSTAPSAQARPQDRARDGHRDWIVIPGTRPGEYWVIERNDVQTRVRLRQRDF
ncbi:MAG: hypothetical protein AB7Q17_05300 [Phycisphaerae bacterium]